MLQEIVKSSHLLKATKKAITIQKAIKINPKGEFYVPPSDHRYKKINIIIKQNFRVRQTITDIKTINMIKNKISVSAKQSHIPYCIE